MKKISFLIVFFVFALLFCLPFQTGKTEAKAEGEFEKMDLGNYWAFWSNFEGVETSRIAPDVKETYAFGDRRWFGLPTVCLTDGGRLWIGFMTGGDGEPHYTNYNAFHYSDDGGVTWSEESLIIEQKNDDIGLYQPHLFMLNGVMQLWLNNGGQNVITIDNPDCDRPSENLHLTRAKKVLPRNAAHRPTILSDKWDNIWLFSGENSNSDSNDIYASANGQKWEIYSSVESSNGNRKWWEGQIVECSDGTLIHVSRLESGADDGVQLAYSYDGGESWTQCAASNGRPFTSYSNKCHMQLLDSGNLLLVIGCSLNARENITAFLSEDNGKTWPYSLSLDARVQRDWFGCGYPEAADKQGPNGEIYVVWDDRFSYCELGFAKFTEADIKAGKIVTPGCYSYSSAVRNKATDGFIYKDIDGITETFAREIVLDKGAPEYEVVRNFPDILHAETAEGTVVVSGFWDCPDYDENRAGRYTFRFNASGLPEGYTDSYGHMTATVVIKDDEKNDSSAKEKGCGSDMAMEGTAALLLAGAATVKKRRGKR